MKRVVVAALTCLALAGCASVATRSPSLSSTPTHAAPTSTTPTKVTPTKVTPVKVTPTKISPPAKPTLDKRVGVSLPVAKLAAFEAVTGTHPSTLGIYTSWASGQLIDKVAYSTAVKAGMTLDVTWQSWAPECNCVNQPSYSDQSIADGAHDAYITAFAQSVKDEARTLGGGITIRLDHEQNGNWYPWGVGVNGNTAADYIAMWRHVHDIFVQQHVTNVRWMWAPNLTYDGATPMGSTYPGAKYVDDVGLSGYNFGPGQYSSWESFTSLYQSSLDAIRQVAPDKPLYLAEIACAAGAGKAAWITDMFAQIKARPYIAGFVWFDWSPAQKDWLIENSQANIVAWRAGVSSLQ